MYDAVRSHMQTEDPVSFRMIVSGMAGTGRLFLFHCEGTSFRPLVCYGTNRGT